VSQYIAQIRGKMNSYQYDCIQRNESIRRKNFKVLILLEAYMKNEQI
jgi:hypothetical protein